MTDGEEIGTWKLIVAQEDLNKQKSEFWGAYMPGFQLALTLSVYFADMIFNHSRFSLVDEKQ